VSGANRQQSLRYLTGWADPLGTKILVLKRLAFRAFSNLQLAATGSEIALLSGRHCQLRTQMMSAGPGFFGKLSVMTAPDSVYVRLMPPLKSAVSASTIRVPTPGSIVGAE
jgi:hypothetical protein